MRGSAIFSGDNVACPTLIKIRDLADKDRVRALASYGHNPTFGRLEKPVLEIHIPGFSGELAGRRLAADFRRRLRSEAAFAGPEELAAAIRRDLESLN
ncbi:MAG: bifunctional riboflavin kinase/FMN adenylyltransferase [candidate division TA06 bacterium ADurb.Bin417]|uniref:riboflavin kinase n=1 Tax=candidate division TA06 bacterium ADurb.Bin417 TaxID=1852828 RepID=A0A1V5MD98_UNCT6|nr:MAG: bifunctional riboflavin kinase/FMN adenylyltransferase [candidate division TA06 bacterium ADurb.Bin417]